MGVARESSSSKRGEQSILSFNDLPLNGRSSTKFKPVYLFKYLKQFIRKLFLGVDLALLTKSLSLFIFLRFCTLRLQSITRWLLYSLWYSVYCSTPRHLTTRRRPWRPSGRNAFHIVASTYRELKFNKQCRRHCFLTLWKRGVGKDYFTVSIRGFSMIPLWFNYFCLKMTKQRGVPHGYPSCVCHDKTLTIHIPKRKGRKMNK